MLTRIEVQNFKAWRRLDMPLARVTGLFGPNNAGKSSVMQFLLLLKQTKNATDRNLLDFGGPDKPLDLGSYADAVHGRDASRDMSWAVDWTLPQRIRVGESTTASRKPALEGDRLRTRCLVRAQSNEHSENDLRPIFMSYGFGGDEFSIEPVDGSAQHYLLTTTNGDFTFARKPSAQRFLPRPVKTHLYPDEARLSYSNGGFLLLFEAEYEKLLDHIFYLGPLRAAPKRAYFWSGHTPEHVGASGEQTVDAALAANRQREARTAGPGHDSRSFLETIDHWLRALDLARDFGIEEVAPGSMLYRVRIRRDAGGAKVDMIDAGFGVSQVLPTLVLLHYVPEGSVVLLEQPELHLHPVAQSGLADIILSAAIRRKLQVVFESHSEALAEVAASGCRRRRSSRRRAAVSCRNGERAGETRRPADQRMGRTGPLAEGLLRRRDERDRRYDKGIDKEEGGGQECAVVSGRSWTRTCSSPRTGGERTWTNSANSDAPTRSSNSDETALQYWTIVA